MNRSFGVLRSVNVSVRETRVSTLGNERKKGSKLTFGKKGGKDKDKRMEESLCHLRRILVLKRLSCDRLS